MQAELAIDAAALAAQTILECSGEIYRAEETAIRMCGGFGLQNAEIICFPTGFTLHVKMKDGTSLTRIKRVRDRTIRLRALDEVNSISRRCCDGSMDAQTALRALEALRSEPSPPNALKALVFAIAAGFFSVMFGGGIKEFVLAAIGGALAQAAVPPLTRLGVPVSLMSLFCAFAASVASLGLMEIVGGSQEAVITGAIMPLLPGLAITNAVRDTMRGDLVSGMARATEALLSAVLIAAGVAFALML